MDEVAEQPLLDDERAFSSIAQEEISNAARLLEHEITMRVGQFADEIMARSGRLLRYADDPERERRRLRDWHLVKIRIRRTANLDPTGDVINARRFGASWQSIGDACWITRQAAHDRWHAAAQRMLHPDQPEEGTPT